MEPVSANRAVRLATALGCTAESWLHMQANYDLWHARRSLRGQVAKIVKASSTAA